MHELLPPLCSRLTVQGLSPPASPARTLWEIGALLLPKPFQVCVSLNRSFFLIL